MFTGLIEDVGVLRRLERKREGALLEIETALPTAEIGLGDSVSCDGTCLTVVDKSDRTFIVELSYETLKRSTWDDAKPGRTVNLERALKVGDRLGGHIVNGHVDGVGLLTRRQKRGESLEIAIQCDQALLRYIVEKGSVAVDGISLTVNKVSANGFDLALIPHTQGKTTLAEKREGQRLNLETDILGKFVEKLITKGGKIDRAFLAEQGFIK